MAINVFMRSSHWLMFPFFELLVCSILLGQVATTQPRPSVPRELTAWFESAAIPLESTRPESSLDDLRPLQLAIGNARIVAMGEATHGTHEFFQLKHRMLEFLVERMGFTVFGIEANWPESLAVNDYVLNGNGDAAQALAGLYFWTWNTEETLDMIRWMRRYNQDPSHVKKVKFFGFDMQTTRVAVSNVETYLQKADPDEARIAADILAPLSDAKGEQEYSKRSEELRRNTSVGIRSILSRFDERKKAYLESAPSEEWILARHNLDIIKQAEEMHPARRWYYSALRDRSMAENVKWILDNEDPGSRIMLWAHNAHVSTLPFHTDLPFDIEPMGMSLRRTYGKEMVVCGFSFDRGSFQAIQLGKGRRSFTVGPAIPGSLDSALGAIGIPVFAIDLRRAPSAGAAADWLNTPQLLRSIGSVYSETAPDAFYSFVNPHAFDVIFFVNQTTAARKNPQTREMEFRGGQ
jgi:erythromycin esterase